MRSPLLGVRVLPALVALLVLGGVGSAQEEPTADAEPLFRFGLVADVQYADKPSAGRRRYAEALGKFAACVEAWNEQPLAFVCQLGDLIDGRGEAEGTRQDLQAVLEVAQRSTAPWLHVVVENREDFWG